MCIAVYKPAGKIIDEKTLRNCFFNNDDGAGFGIVEDDENGKPELNIYKGIFSIEKFLEAFEPYKEKQALIHFRIATHRLINGENCHPWRVNEDLIFIHNGVISNINKNTNISDTGNFATEILVPLAKVDPDFWKKKEFKWVIENAIGSGNKLVLMDTKGDHVIFNEKAGETEDGVWFSNNSFRHSNGRRFTNYYSGPGYGSSMMGGDDDEFSGDFEVVSSGASKKTENDLENNMSQAADIRAEETKTYDLDEIDTLLEQEQQKAQAAQSSKS